MIFETPKLIEYVLVVIPFFAELKAKIMHANQNVWQRRGEQQQYAHGYYLHYCLDANDNSIFNM